MASTPVFLFLFLFLLLSLLLPSTLSHSRPTAYTELKSNNFPAGLLPANVLSYALNRTSGRFAVRLDDHCRITLPPDNYLAAYSPTVTGTLLHGRIADLDGIKVWAFFRWWSITGIRDDGDDLVFEVGVASAKYSKRNFRESPECEGRSRKAAV